MTSARRIYWLNGTLIALFFIASAAAWDHLGSSVPQHFGLSGRADAWSEKTWLSWFALPIAAAVSAIVMYLVSFLGRRKPGLYNMPRKAQFLALSGDRRVKVIAMLEAFCAWVAVALTVHMVAAQYAMYSAAINPSDRIPLLTVLTLVGGTTALGIGGMLFMQRVDERIRQLASEETGGPG